MHPNHINNFNNNHYENDNNSQMLIEANSDPIDKSGIALLESLNVMTSSDILEMGFSAENGKFNQFKLDKDLKWTKCLKI